MNRRPRFLSPPPERFHPWSYSLGRLAVADKTRHYQTKAPSAQNPTRAPTPSMATATAASSSSLTAPLLRPNPKTNPATRSLPLLRNRRCIRAVTAAVAGGAGAYGAAQRRGIWSIRDDLVVPKSPYFPVEYAAGQERGPSPMVMERFQSVVSQLFQHRIIRCGGPVEDDMANIIVAQLLYLDAVDPTKDIIMYVNSPGGSVTAGMAIFDTMKHIRPDVSTVCIGLAASMGAFLLSAGTKGKRYSLPNSRIMIHQPLGGAQGQETDLEIQDGAPNERKIMKLCEYAAKNPLRIPKIAKFLEQRTHKELRAAHVSFVRIITEAYSKLLFICKEQMAYFAISLVNVLTELLESKQENVHILGCQTLANFINSQVDNTYARNIESLVRKVCALSHQQGEEHRLLRAASLQCLSAMIWFMKEHSYIFADFDEIVKSVLENYRTEESVVGGDRHASQHNWVDEIARSEGRPGIGGGNDVNISSATVRLRPARNSSALTRDERESPEVWSHICVQKLAELAKESTTMRRVLDPMLSYFDTKKQWTPRHGLALLVLSDMAYPEKSSGNEQLILTAVIRHLDHKNVSRDVQTKSDIIQTATSLARQLRSRGYAAELVVAGDLCKHLRKTLEAVELGSVEDLNSNESLQNFLEDCLMEVVRGINDVRPLYDMMAITLENLPSIPTVARATLGSLLILSHIISLTSASSNTPMVFPEALLQQILKSMVHPDIDTRVGAHHMFSAIIVRGPSHLRSESEYLYETKKQSRNTSVFASATALLEKLRREKDSLSSDKPRNMMHDDVKERNTHEEDNKYVWSQKNSAYFSKLIFSIIERYAKLSSSVEEANIAMLTEDQTNQLLSAFWIQANQTDNTPFNYEAIGHSYSLTVLSSRLKNSSNSNIVHFFQLPLSLRSIALTPSGVLPASCQRSIFILSTSMLAFTGKVCHITELSDLLRCFTSPKVDPYLRIGEDLQLYVRLHSDLGSYGSESDQEVARSILSDCRTKVGINDQRVLDVIASALSSFSEMDRDVLAKELTEMFTPEEMPLFGSNSALDWANVNGQAFSDESLSFDEECSRTSSVDCGLHESPITNTASSISKITLPQSVPHVLGVGQLLESALHVAGQVAGASVSTSPLPYDTMTSQCEALGLGTRKKLSSWLVNGHESTPDNPMPSLPTAHHSIIPKVNSCGFESIHHMSAEPSSIVKLPPTSPFDNFLKAAYRTQPEL